MLRKRLGHRHPDPSVSVAGGTQATDQAQCLPCHTHGFSSHQQGHVSGGIIPRPSSCWWKNQGGPTGPTGTCTPSCHAAWGKGLLCSHRSLSLEAESFVPTPARLRRTGVLFTQHQAPHVLKPCRRLGRGGISFSDVAAEHREVKQLTHVRTASEQQRQGGNPGVLV